MKKTNSEIFDYIVEAEDNLLHNVRIDLKKIAFDRFGKQGIKVVDKY